MHNDGIICTQPLRIQMAFVLVLICMTVQQIWTKLLLLLKIHHTVVDFSALHHTQPQVKSRGTFTLKEVKYLLTYILQHKSTDHST